MKVKTKQKKNNEEQQKMLKEQNKLHMGLTINQKSTLQTTGLDTQPCL